MHFNIGDIPMYFMDNVVSFKKERLSRDFIIY
jgi:hypothetical protein